MKKWFYPLLLQTLLLASQPHSLLGFRGLIFTPASGVFPNDGESGFGYRNIQTPHDRILKWHNRTDKATENHLFFGSLVFLPRLEFTGLITLAPESRGNDGTDTYKDFALFAHIHIVKEKRRIPSIMLGIHDFYSYSFYNALFLSSSKTFRLNTNLKISSHFGYGVDWMNQHYGNTGPDRYAPVNHYLVGLFGGTEILYGKNTSFILEYDTHQINSGIRVNLFDKFRIMAVLLNMDTFSFGMDYSFLIL